MSLPSRRSQKRCWPPGIHKWCHHLGCTSVQTLTQFSSRIRGPRRHQWKPPSYPRLWIRITPNGNSTGKWKSMMIHKISISSNENQWFFSKLQCRYDEIRWNQMKFCAKVTCHDQAQQLHSLHHGHSHQLWHWSWNISHGRTAWRLPQIWTKR